jgi:transcriptional regulator with XRE-family HTH domain
MTFGERLNELRDASGLSQAALSRAAEIGLPTLKDYEGDRRSPSLEIAQRLAKVLGQTCQAFDGCDFLHATRKRDEPPARESPRAKGRPRKASTEVTPSVEKAKTKTTMKRGKMK